jgi:hypothetical protein
VSQNWRKSHITLDADEELAFRWDAPNYQSCLPNIYPVNYVFKDTDIGSTQGDTERLQIDIREHDKTYILQCKRGDTTVSKGITVIIAD